MTRPQLKAALDSLLAFPDLPFQEMSPPLSYYHRSRQERHAEKFLDLAADFAEALEQEGVVWELRKRAAPFGRFAGRGSRYQELRDEAYHRLLSAFRHSSADGTAECLSAAQLRGHPSSGQAKDLQVYWADVEKYLGDPHSVLRFPCATFTYCELLVEFLSYSCPEMVRLGYELRGIREQVEGTHLRGCFLLAAAHDMVGSVSQDVGPYRDLVETIVKAPEITVAAKAAAENLVTALPVEDGRSRTTTEEHDGGNKASGVARQAAAKNADTADEGRADDAAASTGEEESNRDGLVIWAVTVRPGNQCYQLVAEGRPPFSVPPEYNLMFGAFVQNILRGAPGEPVAWDVLRAALHLEAAPAVEQTAPEATSEGPKKKKRKRPTAGDELRKARYALNQEMLKWGRPPAKKNWIRGKVGSGYYLNDTCKWQLDEALTEYFTGRKSVWGLSTDPAKLAKDTVDKDHKLPAQPERPHKRREDDEE